MNKTFAVQNTFEIIRENMPIPAECQSIAFKNIGAVDCSIGGFPLKVGDPMLTLENASILAVDASRYDLVFDGKQTGDKKLIVIRTFYDFTKAPQNNINR